MKSTHPDGKERVAALDRIISKSYRVAGGHRLAERYQKRMKQLPEISVFD